MKLKLGIMTRQELAEWFDIQPKSLSNKATKEKKYAELRKYARFNVLNKGQVEILEIFEDIYVKPSVTAERIKACKKDLCKFFPQPMYIVISWENARFYDELSEEEKTKITEKTMYNRYLDAAMQLFGNTRKHIKGYAGSRKFQYTIWDDLKQTYRPLSEEENKVKNKIVEKYYGKVDVDIAEQRSHLDGQYCDGEIDKQTYLECLSMLEGDPKERYKFFIAELTRALKGKIQRMYLCEWNIFAAEELFKQELITERQRRLKNDKYVSI